MLLRHRPMRPKDIAECVDIVKTHPVIGPRYGRAIDDLRAAWLQLLGREAMITAVMEAVEDLRARICFVAVSVCVTDDFIRELKTAPLFWVGPELAKRTVQGDCPVLTDRQLREQNSRGGVSNVTWEAFPRAGYEAHGELYRKIMECYIETHQGFLWKELIAGQVESPQRLQWNLRNGGLLWDAERGRYVDALDRDPEEIVREPHIVGLTRDIEISRPASWVGALFRYHPPRFGFSRSEQELLLSALDGATDEELSKSLHVSLATVKKQWLSIYRRVAAGLPELISSESTEGPESKRGKEKRRHLLAYLHEHPEELRPTIAKSLLS